MRTPRKLYATQRGQKHCAVSLYLSVSRHWHAAIPNIAVQPPFSLFAFPHHNVLPIIENLVPLALQGVLAHLIGGISLSVHVKRGQRRSFDPRGDDALPKLLDRFRPTHNVAMG